MSKNPVSDQNYNRKANLRQHLLRASRTVNNTIVENLQQHGFMELTSSHTALLSNLDLDGNSITTIAQRAGMTKQAMGRLSDELVKLKFITRTSSKNDKRAIVLRFTTTGLELMNKSFSIMDEIEKRCTHRMGEKHFKSLLTSLQSIVDELETFSDDSK